MKRNTLISIALMLNAIPASAQLFNEADYTPQATRFSIFAPSDAPNVKLRIYADAVSNSPIREIDMNNGGKNFWNATVEGDLKGSFYTFDTGNQETPGIFAKAVGICGRRAVVVDMDDTDPIGWSDDKRPPLKSPSSLVIYEMHHRDFSASKDSPFAYKGKFLALTEDAAIAHLTKLGVNAVHLLPSFDFASIDEKSDLPQYNWGYDPLNYNVPEGSYSTDPSNPIARIREFKLMVMALHKAGIRVILDVVYNHTFDINGSNFQRAFPDYFYRKKTSGEWSDGSGCGNETASERPMMRRFMIESVKYWIQEYHIDGFRFDLMGIHDITTMNEIRQEVDKIDPSIFIYGEGWSAGQCAYPEKKLAMKVNTGKLDGIAAFSDDMRDALRGPFSDDTKGAFLAGIPGEEESLKFGLAGAVKHPQVDMGKVNYSRKPWAKQPTQMIAYVSCHDDMCLVDRLKTSMPGIGEDELIRLDMLAQTAVMTSQGVAFMLSGEEMLRDKKGVHNSYNSPDSVNVLPWKNIYKYPQVMDYYSNLISLRKEHPAFTLGDAAQIRRHLDFIHTSDNLVAFRIGEHAGGDSWKNIIVVLNSNKTPKDISVPAAIYTIVCENGKIDKNGIRQQTVGEASSKIKVPAQSALIMHD